MRKRFVAIREAVPGAAWLARFTAGRGEAEAWYRGTGRGEPLTARECAKALRTYMPELLAPYERACALVGNDELAHQILSQYRPPPLPHGCTQAIWLGDEGPALLRNYDYPLDVVSDHFESTSWFGRAACSSTLRTCSIVTPSNASTYSVIDTSDSRFSNSEDTGTRVPRNTQAPP